MKKIQFVAIALVAATISAGCTQATPDAVLDPVSEAQRKDWLANFTRTDAAGFYPTLTRDGKQCTVQNLAGRWVRTWKATEKERGSALWSFTNTGEILCEGPACRGKAGLPKRFAMREVFNNTPQRNVGLLVIFESNTIKRTTCEVDDKDLYFGDDLSTGMRFVRYSPTTI